MVIIIKTIGFLIIATVLFLTLWLLTAPLWGKIGKVAKGVTKSTENKIKNNKEDFYK